MFRFARAVIGRTNALLSQNVAAASAIQSNILRNIPGRGFSVLSNVSSKPLYAPGMMKFLSLPQTTNACGSSQLESVPVRTVTKWSYRSGKRKTVKAVIRRFYRLHWGGWIRTRCGRHKKMWKKSTNLKHRLRQHVLVNKTQAHLLDKMVTKFWKRPKHYVEDIYEPYHDRSFYYARKTPMPYPSQPLKQPKTVWELSKMFD